MEYQEVLQNAKTKMGPYCRACPVCDGRACRNQIPGPGAKGMGDTAIRNFEKWREIRLNLDTIGPGGPVSTEAALFGRTFRAPLFAGPVGAVEIHYGDAYDCLEYNDVLVSACREAGVAAFTGDGTDPQVMEAAVKAIGKAGGLGIPTIKPWDLGTVTEKLALARAAGAFAVAMDIDAAGLPILRGRTPPAGPKTVEELGEISRAAGVPFLVKGIMTVRGAEKAKSAGAAAIVVSNHGGRVLDQCPATAEVLEEIAAAVGDSMPVLVDGGIRSGADIFKALALGARAAVIARPFVVALYGGGAAGVQCYVEKLTEELADCMALCGAHRVEEITREMVR